MHPARVSRVSNRHPRVSRRAFLGAGAALGALAFAGNAAMAAPRKQPNVVLVMTDDQGYGDLSCLGNPVLKTPNIDRLHGESLRLSNFHVSPTCAPSRAALMTGRYNNRCGVWHTIMGRSILQRDERTMADYFSEAGYQTGIFGKWHLGDNYPYRPQDRGFMETLIHGGGGVGQTPDYWGNSYFDDTYFHNGTPAPFKGYCTDVFFEGARDFIRANRDTPFFCYLPTNAPHGPYRVAPEYSQPFKDRGLKEDQANFYGMLVNIDENMGRLLATVDELGIAGDTIFIFMTDNGTSEGDAGGMRGRKGSEYEGGHRVPCFIRWPHGPIAAKRDVPMVTAHLDLLPTLLDLCGVPSGGGLPFDGINLRPWLEDPGAPEPDRALVVDSQRIDQPEKWRKSAVMEKHWRLVNGTELYNLESDPEQKADRAKEEPERLARMRGQYVAWWEDVSRQFDHYVPIVLGAAGQSPVRLTCHDWHGEKVPWNQPYILRGDEGNGFWAVDVAEASEYQFDLRRWPLEADAPINSAVNGGKALSITEARLSIAGQKHATPVGDADHYARITVKLDKGEARLNTAFVCGDGKDRGAYYVVVERVG